MDVEARAEDDIATILEGLVADSLADGLDEFCVPGGGQTGAYGEARSIVGVGVVLPGGVDVDAGRAVGEHSGGDAETWNLYSDACCSGHQFRLMSEHSTAADEAVVTTAHENLGFLFKGHSLEHLVDVIGAELWLGICCHSECCCE